MQWFSGQRMGKRHFGTVQGMAGEEGFIRTVHRISHQRVSNIGHMHPDLVGTSRLEPQPQQGELPIRCQRLPVSIKLPDS